MRLTRIPLATCLVVAPVFAQEPATQGTIVGSVVGPLGKPISGARVWIQAWPSKAAIAETKTSNGGMFALRRVPTGGTLYVCATAPGLTQGRAYARLSDGRKRATSSIRLWSAGTIRGRVRGKDGSPIGDAQVCAAFDSARGYGFEPQAESRTDDKGRFELYRVPLGDITVRAIAKNYTIAKKSVYLRDESDIEIELAEGGGVRIDVRVEGLARGQAEGLRVRLLPYASGGHQVLPTSLVVGETAADGTWSVSGMPDYEYRISVSGKGMSFAPRTARIKPGEPHKAVFRAHRDEQVILRGRVLRPDGKPLARADLLCRASNGGRRTTTATDESGRFEMKSPLSPGTPCVFYLTGSSLVMAPDDTEKQRFSRSPERWHRTTITTDEEYVLLTAHGSEVRGQARLKDGTPIRLQRITMQHNRPNTTPSWGTFAYAMTDRRGRFVFRAIPTTEDEVRVRTTGQQGTGASKAFRIRPGATLGDIEVTCDAPATIHGVVLDQNGKPLPGARVWLRDYDLTGRQRNGSVAEVYTDHAGRYRHVGVSPGGHKLQVHVVGDHARVELEEGGEIFEAKPNAELERTLRIK